MNESSLASTKWRRQSGANIDCSLREWPAHKQLEGIAISSLSGGQFKGLITIIHRHFQSFATILSFCWVSKNFNLLGFVLGLGLDFRFGSWALELDSNLIAFKLRAISMFSFSFLLLLLLVLMVSWTPKALNSPARDSLDHSSIVALLARATKWPKSEPAVLAIGCRPSQALLSHRVGWKSKATHYLAQ